MKSVIRLFIFFNILLCSLTLSAETVLRVAHPAASPTKGNPFGASGTTPTLFYTAIYDRITDIDNNGNIVPELALSWKAVNQNQWRFKLRPGVVFSNGEKFTSETIKTVFDTVRGEAINARSWYREAPNYPRVEIIDELTIDIFTLYPSPLAPAYLSALWVVPHGHLKNVGLEGLVNDPIGSGPFKLDSWEPERIILSAYENSWRKPKIDKMEALIVPDSSARYQALVTGQIDVAVAISTDQIDILEMNGHRAQMRNPIRTLVLVLKSNDPSSPFSDVRVRQAFNYAVDKKTIAKVLLSDLVKPASQPALPFAIGYDDNLDPYPYDPERAKRLLDEAGYKNGVSFIIETVSGFIPNDTAILQRIASDVAKVGMDMEVRLITYPQLARNSTLGEMSGHGFIMDFTNRYADALKPIINTNHSCRGAGPWFCEEPIQQVINEADKTFDLEKRIMLTKNIVKYYRDVAQSLFLFPLIGLEGIHKRVKVWKPMNDRFMYHLVEIEN